MNLPVIDMTESKDHPVANSMTSENETGLEEATSDNQAVDNIIPTRNPLGLLDLPSEIRLMIFRHLLVYPHGLDFGYWALGPLPSVDILRTSRLIHREAFDVLYGENQFANCFWSASYSLIQFPQVIDTIQNIYVEIDMDFKYLAVGKFLKLMRCFGNGNPSIIRKTLTVEFLLESLSGRPLDWFIRALGRFTNFRAIEVHVYLCGGRDRTFRVLEYLELALEPVLGHSEYRSREGKGLRFHPVDHQIRSSQPDHDDWADTLDGIRLEWNEHETNADNSKTQA